MRFCSFMCRQCVCVCIKHPEYCFLCFMVFLTPLRKFVIWETRIRGENHSQTGYTLIICCIRGIKQSTRGGWGIRCCGNQRLGQFMCRKNTAHQRVQLSIKVLSHGNRHLNMHDARHCLDVKEEYRRTKWRSQGPELSWLTLRLCLRACGGLRLTHKGVSPAQL